MRIKKHLGNRIRGWFPQEPTLKAPRIQMFMKPAGKPWDIGKNVSNFLFGVFYLSLMFFNLSLFSSLESFFWVFWIPFGLVFVGLNIYNLRKYHGLHDPISGGLFAALNGTVIVANLLFLAKALELTSYLILLAASAAVFTILYAWAQRAGKRGLRLPRMSLVFSLALIGIVGLSSSLAVVYHIEDTSVMTHRYEIFNEYFRMERQLPDEVISINLTTADRIEVDMTKQQNANIDPSASILFTISDQTIGPNATVYFSSSTIDSLWVKSWDPPKNGSYVFTLHFNYIAANYVWVGVTKVWSTIENIPSEVATPLLADFMIPTMILAAALLAASISIPIRSLKGPNLRGSIKQKWNETWSQWKRSYF